ncbi:MAG: DUF2975 domain-containing protein [Propionibacteriaceae bacterium]|nr:DUF2975 domain-containing protein [Propionibacteriaceae bacterium]
MSKKLNWTPRMSTTLSMVVAWIGLILGVAAVPALKPLLGVTTHAGYAASEDYIATILPLLYACLVVGILALVILLRLLGDIRKEQVFTTNNVRRLRLISYCGFSIMAVSIVGAILTVPDTFFVAVALIAGVLSLLMRVVKNVIDTARLLKEEADYTI